MHICTNTPLCTDAPYVYTFPLNSTCSLAHNVYNIYIKLMRTPEHLHSMFTPVHLPPGFTTPL